MRVCVIPGPHSRQGPAGGAVEEECRGSVEECRLGQGGVVGVGVDAGGGAKGQEGECQSKKARQRKDWAGFILCSDR